MKKVSAIVAALAALLALALPVAAGAKEARAEKSVIVVLAGDEAANTISVGVTPDGRGYTIESSAPLEVGGSICSHPSGREDQLLCEAAPVAGFEVNGNGGDDTIALGASVPIPATLRGGPGNDRLTGGAGADKLVGGAGNDALSGGAGNDSLFGGPGEDKLAGGAGDDNLVGGAGLDTLVGGAGTNQLVQ